MAGLKKREKRMFRKFDLQADPLNYNFVYNDTETAELHRKLNNNADVDINDLRRVSLCKSNRVMSVSDETLSKLQKLTATKSISVIDDLSRDVIECLVSCDGIGYPMASAILKFLRPEVFPIIDVRAYRALTGTKPYYGTYTYEKYCDYTLELQAIAKELNRPLLEIDEQLYCFDEKHNGAI